MFARILRNAVAPVVLAGALLTVPTLAMATSPYDGTWVIDVPSADPVAGTTYSVCAALQFPIQIKDGRVTGSLTEVPAADSSMLVEAGTGRSAAPITGTVDPSGAVQAQWQNYHAVGALAGDSGQVTIKGECGPRIATAIRVSP